MLQPPTRNDVFLEEKSGCWIFVFFAAQKKIDASSHFSRPFSTPIPHPSSSTHNLPCTSTNPPDHLDPSTFDVLRLGSFSPKIQDTLEEFGTVADARLTTFDI